MEKLCLECGTTLHGRADKRFCDDACRNAYNNRLNSDQVNLVRNVNNILRRNRRVLLEFLKEEKMIKIPRDRLNREGFDFKFHTHTYTNAKGQTYFFVYEMGYLPLEHDFYLIVKREP